MSLQSDIKKKLKEKYYKEKNNAKYDYKKWLINIATSAGITKDDYNFLDIFNQLIEASRFLDSLQDLEKFSDQNATLSKFISNLQKNLNPELDKYKSSIGEQQLQAAFIQYQKKHPNLAQSLSSIWETPTSFSLTQYDQIFKQAESAMKQAYIKHTKFEQLLNSELHNEKNPNQRYYSFFKLDQTGKELEDVVTVSSKLMDQIIEKTELVHLRVIPQSKEKAKSIADYKYSLSLGIDSSDIITDIMNAAKQVGITETDGKNLVKGIFREEQGKLVHVKVDDKFKTEYRTLYNASQGEDRTLISQTGGQLSPNRLTEVLFNKDAINNINIGNGFMHVEDQLSSLVGFDASYSTGGGTSVKTFGAGNTSIQLMANSSVKSMTNMFLSMNPLAFLDNDNFFNKLSKTPEGPEDHMLSQEAVAIKREYFDNFRNLMPNNAIKRKLDIASLAELEQFMDTSAILSGFDDLTLAQLLANPQSQKEAYNKAKEIVEPLMEKASNYQDSLEASLEEMSIDELEDLIVSSLDGAEYGEE